LTERHVASEVTSRVDESEKMAVALSWLVSPMEESVARPLTRRVRTDGDEGPSGPDV
jgi:hypothetical protein